MDHAWRGEAEGERSPAMADAASLMIAPSTGTWMRWNAGVAREPYSADGGPSAASVVGHLSFLQTKPNQTLLSQSKDIYVYAWGSTRNVQTSEFRLTTFTRFRT
jgi:hypothetical protein